jgi:hypothetical protein
MRGSKKQIGSQELSVRALIVCVSAKWEARSYSEKKFVNAVKIGNVEVMQKKFHYK